MQRRPHIPGRGWERQLQAQAIPSPIRLLLEAELVYFLCSARGTQMQRKKPLLPPKVRDPQPSRGVGNAQPTSVLERVLLTPSLPLPPCSGPAFSWPDGSFYNQGYWSNFHPCGHCSVPGNPAAPAGADITICLRSKDGLGRVASLVMRLLWFHSHGKPLKSVSSPSKMLRLLQLPSLPL